MVRLELRGAVRCSCDAAYRMVGDEGRVELELPPSIEAVRRRLGARLLGAGYSEERDTAWLRLTLPIVGLLSLTLPRRGPESRA